VIIMRKQENLFGKQPEKNPNQLPVNILEKEVEELPIYLTEFKPEVQDKIMRFLGIKTAQELNLDTFPIFVLPKTEINDR
jgi:hypothetical protein